MLYMFQAHAHIHTCMWVHTYIYIYTYSHVHTHTTLFDYIPQGHTHVHVDLGYIYIYSQWQVWLKLLSNNMFGSPWLMFLFLLFVQAGICAAVLSGFPKHEPGPGATQGSARVSVICEAARSSHHRQRTPACSLPRLGPGSCQAATWFRMRQLLQPRRDAIREAHWLLAVSPLCRENGAVVMLGFFIL